MKFKVLNGSHCEDNKVFHAGDIVQSKKNLDQIFVNKFERVETAESSTETASDSVKAEKTDNDTDQKKKRSRRSKKQK